MKRTFCLILAIVLALSMAIAVSAVGNEDFSQNYHMSPTPPWNQISTYGANPPTVSWNINTQGTYTFAGTASYTTLYLDRLIYGSNYYAVYVLNRSYTNILTVNPRDGIPATSTAVAPRGALNEIYEQKAGKNYFSLSFNAPCDVEGFVAKWEYK